MATHEGPPQSALDLAEKNFRPAAVEADLYQWWERSGFFTPDQKNATQPFVMMLPLPNITGDLHLGHALGFGGYEDLMARYHRMLGEPTLYMPGTDHAGIIAQVVVENELAKEGITRQQLGREKCLEEMWKWMDHYRPRIEKQLRMLGCSLDWSRPHFTMEPAHQRAVRTHFIRLHKKGHLYRADRIVHWCLRDQTTYSDLEVKHITRTDTLYYVRYPWADRMPPGTPDVIVATTRPETIVADVAIAVHPDDERWKALVGTEVLVPGVERRIKIIADEAVDPTFGTGALKITPGHDQTDFEIGQRHGLPVLSVIDKRGMMTPAAGPLAGPDREAGRKMMVEKLRASGLLVKEDPITHAIAVHDRCGTVDEPLVLKQWWVRMDRLAPPAIAAVRDGRITLVPKYQEKVYFNWMENIRDWPVSRQIWWGHSIPAWYCRDCDNVIVPDEDAPDPMRCTRCRSDDIYQDPDVLDTWFSSGLWPFSTLGWPDNTDDYKTYYPTTLLITGYDILFFWAARMIMMGIHFTGQVPFRAVYLHSLVRTGSGEKMSKSKGTGLDPVALNEQYGTDAMRFCLASMAAPGTDIVLSEDKLASARNFANKIWNAARFLFVNLDKFEASGTKLEQVAAPEVRAKAPYAYRGSIPLVDAWMFARLAATVELVNEALANYRFHEAAQGMYQFFWSDFCDWYIEWVKPELQSADSERATVAWKNLFAAFDAALRLLHQFMPFLTEELWHQLPQKVGAKSIALDQFPEAQGHWKNTKATADVAAIQEVVTALRNMRAELKLDPKKRVTADFSTSDAGTGDLAQANRGAIERFAVLSELRFIPRQQLETKREAV